MLSDILTYKRDYFQIFIEQLIDDFKQLKNIKEVALEVAKQLKSDLNQQILLNSNFQLKDDKTLMDFFDKFTTIHLDMSSILNDNLLNCESQIKLAIQNNLRGLSTQVFNKNISLSESLNMLNQISASHH